jgi:hypothetical protein
LTALLGFHISCQTNWTNPVNVKNAIIGSIGIIQKKESINPINLTILYLLSPIIIAGRYIIIIPIDINCDSVPP